MSPRHPDRTRCASAVAVALLLLAAGCASSESFSVDEARLARGYLPPTQQVTHHPDSLAHLTLVEEEGKLKFEFDRSYEEIMRAWSASWQSTGSGATEARNAFYRTFATLWTLELSLASLIPERGVDNLSEELARDIIQQRKEEYRQVVQIDLYRFAGSPITYNAFSGVQLDGPGTRIRLIDAEGNEYAPIRVESAVPEQAFLGGRNVLYARNFIYFERFVDGEDLLGNFERLELEIDELQPDASYVFTWTLTPPDAAASQ